MATGRALIDVEEGNLTLRVQNEKVEFNIFKAIKMFDNERHVCNRIDVIDECIDEVREECIESNLLDLESVTGTEEEVITALLELSSLEAEAEIYENDDDLSVECFMTDNFIENTDDISMCAATAEKPEVQDVERSREGLVLKPLPSNLKYVFLGENRTFPVIVNSLLKDDELTMLIQVL